MAKKQDSKHEKEIRAKKVALYELGADLNKALKDYKLLTPDLIARVHEIFSLDDYDECRDAYIPVIMNCFQFEATKIKASAGKNKDERIDNQIKTIAGEFLVKVFKELKINEFGIVLFIITTGQYISNTTLDVVEQVADDLIEKGHHTLIVKQLKDYVEAGGMKQPGDEKITPLTEQKKLRMQILIKRLTPKFDGRLLSDMSGED